MQCLRKQVCPHTRDTNMSMCDSSCSFQGGCSKANCSVVCSRLSSLVCQVSGERHTGRLQARAEK